MLGVGGVRKVAFNAVGGPHKRLGDGLGRVFCAKEAGEKVESKMATAERIGEADIMLSCLLWRCIYDAWL